MEINKVFATIWEVLRTLWGVLVFLLHAAYLIIVSILVLLLPSTWMAKKNVKGEIVLVTGGGGGLGRLMALRLAKLGAIVVLWDVNVQALQETVALVQGVGGKAYGFKCDLTDKEDVYRVAKRVQKEVGDVSILINNAGVGSARPLLTTPDHMIKQTFDVNTVAHFWTVKAFLPRMIEKHHGHIVNLASMAGYVGVSRMTDYCASKFAVVGFSKSLKLELETDGLENIHVTAICPYFIKQTGMFSSVSGSVLFPTLKPDDVAARTVRAILREEFIVTVPALLKYILFLNVMVPWSVSSLLLRKALPDVVDPVSPSPATISPTREVVEEWPGKENGAVTSRVSGINAKIVSSGKDL